jgi:hypothetical protein
MARQYWVVDCRPGSDDNSRTPVTSFSPEGAARLVLQEDLGRGGVRGTLRARVYFQDEGQPLTMVRLYSKACE